MQACERKIEKSIWEAISETNNRKKCGLQKLIIFNFCCMYAYHFYWLLLSAQVATALQALETWLAIDKV